MKGYLQDLGVTQTEQVQPAMQRIIEQFGRVDVLINNASVWLSSPFLETSKPQWDLELAVNLTGPFLCSQAVVPSMLAQQSGVIINITDLSAFQTWPGYASHSVAKTGLLALTRVMAAELAPHIRLNAIAPGTVLLPEHVSEEKVRWARENSLLKRIGEPEDIARTILFLIEMDFVTGAVYCVDGGRQLA